MSHSISISRHEKPTCCRRSRLRTRRLAQMELLLVEAALQWSNM